MRFVFIIMLGVFIPSAVRAQNFITDWVFEDEILSSEILEDHFNAIRTPDQGFAVTYATPVDSKYREVHLHVLKIDPDGKLVNRTRFTLFTNPYVETVALIPSRTEGYFVAFTESPSDKRLLRRTNKGKDLDQLKVRLIKFDNHGNRTNESQVDARIIAFPATGIAADSGRYVIAGANYYHLNRYLYFNESSDPLEYFDHDQGGYISGLARLPDGRLAFSSYNPLVEIPGALSADVKRNSKEHWWIEYRKSEKWDRSGVICLQDGTYLLYDKNRILDLYEYSPAQSLKENWRSEACIFNDVLAASGGEILFIGSTKTGGNNAIGCLNKDGALAWLTKVGKDGRKGYRLLETGRNEYAVAGVYRRQDVADRFFLQSCFNALRDTFYIGRNNVGLKDAPDGRNTIAPAGMGDICFVIPDEPGTSGDVDGNGWVHIHTNGTTGWVHGRDIRPDRCTGTYTDNRNGTSYRTVKLAGLWWMADNLAYRPPNSPFYDNYDTTRLEKDGYAYFIPHIQKVCPEEDGWYLPSKADWQSLLDLYGDLNAAYEALQQGGSSGFEAVFSGYFSEGEIKSSGERSVMWYADPPGAVQLSVKFKSVAVGPVNRNYGYSIRCVRK